MRILEPAGRILFIKPPEIFRPAPVLDINQSLERLAEIGHPESEYSVTVHNRRTGLADNRRYILCDAAGADFSCYYRSTSQKTHFCALLPAVRNAASFLFFTYHAHDHSEAWMSVQDGAAAGFFKNGAVRNQFAGRGYADCRAVFEWNRIDAAGEFIQAGCSL